MTLKYISYNLFAQDIILKKHITSADKVAFTEKKTLTRLEIKKKAE